MEISTPIPQQAVFETPVAVKAKRLHKPDHRWLAYLYLICQFCDGAPGALLRISQHLVCHPLLRGAQGSISAFHSV